MRFVHKEQKIARKVIEQTGRRLAGFAAVQMAGVVFNAVAVAQFLDHFQIQLGTLFQALGLHQLAVLLEVREPRGQFIADVPGRALQVVLGRNEVASRVEHGFAHFGQHFAGERVDFAHGVDIVAEKLQTQSPLVMIGRNDFQSVSAHPERAAVKVIVVALVMRFHETGDQIVHGQALPHFHGNDHLGVVFRRTQAVNTGHRGHDDHVAPGQQGVSGRMAQLVYIVVDGGIFLDVGIRGGHIGLGLVVVVIAHKIFHGIARKKLAKFIVELSGQGFIGRKHQGRAIAAGDHIGHGEGFARAGHAQEHLRGHTGPDIVSQGGYSLRLVAHGRVAGLQTERSG